MGACPPRRSWKLAFVSGFWGLGPHTITGALHLETLFVPRSKFLATPLLVIQCSAKFKPENLYFEYEAFTAIVSVAGQDYRF